MHKLTGAVVLLAAATAADAYAGSCNGEFGWLSKGTVYPMAKGSFIFTGEFSGTFFNADPTDPVHKTAMQCPGWWHVKGDQGTSGGTCIARDSEDDKIFFEWSGSGGYPETAGPFEITGGTGKYAGISGAGDFEAATVAMDDAGNGMGYATWTNCSYSMK